MPPRPNREGGGRRSPPPHPPTPLCPPFLNRRLLPRLLPLVLLILLPAVFFCGCGRRDASGTGVCRIVLEEGGGFICDDYVRSVPAGGTAVFTIVCEDGYAVTGADCGAYSLVPGTGGRMVLTIPDVRYSDVIALTVERSEAVIRYDRNDGSCAAPVEVPLTPSHLRWNTAGALFTRDGYTLTGWNTAPDGTGTAVGLGSRIEPAEGLVLYAQWSRWTDVEAFDREPYADGVAVTAYRGRDDTITVPAAIDGYPVRLITAGAFEDVSCDTVILPDTLYGLEDGAFRGCALSVLCLFDNIRVIGDAVFEGCENLATLRLNAAEEPVYSGTYFDVFQDKLDRLLCLRDEKKLVLFGGSSVRFGCDCTALDAAFPDYEIVNMGVFAYTNALPQLELILSCMNEGDILLHSPEFDASEMQFCASDDIEYRFFNMVESNYDALSLLDLRGYDAVFTPLADYLTVKDPMTKKSYALSAADFDEDGMPVDTPSYNEYGDYIVYRPNAASALPVYGDPVRYTVAAFPTDSRIEPLNRVYRRFLEKGVTVLFAYAPRNELALSPDSTPEARAALDRSLRDNLCVPVITPLEDSLWSGVYLYGTDNHLSTEGAAIHTEQIIAALRAYLDEYGG